MRIDDLRTTLHDGADELDGTEPLAPRDRHAAVRRRVAASRSRRRAGRGIAATVLVAGAVAGAMTLPSLLATPPQPAPVAPQEPMVRTPPRLAGYQLPREIKVRDVTYVFDRGEETAQERGSLRVAVPSRPEAQVIAWSTSPRTRGQVVVTADDAVISRSTAGALEDGFVLAAGRPHIVVVQPTRPEAGNRIGFGLYVPEVEVTSPCCP